MGPHLLKVVDRPLHLLLLHFLMFLCLLLEQEFMKESGVGLRGRLPGRGASVALLHGDGLHLATGHHLYRVQSRSSISTEALGHVGDPHVLHFLRLKREN